MKDYDECEQRILDVKQVAKEIKDFINRKTDVENTPKDCERIDLNQMIDFLVQQAHGNLHNASSRSKERQEFPERFKKRFPFNLSGKLRNFLLKVFNRLFFDQRLVNEYLILAVMNTLKALNELNQHSEKLLKQVKGIAKTNIQSKNQVNNPEYFDFNSGEFDQFYDQFESESRGSRESVLQKLEMYIRIIKRYAPLADGKIVLDLGCGRGEFLSLLKENNIEHLGIDKNQHTINLLSKLKLKVDCGDCLDYLTTTPTASVAVITAFHIVEHLPFNQFLFMVNECSRVLVDGGLLIIETPNIKNIIVGASNFHSDPTHISPLYPETLCFSTRYFGFEKIDIQEYTAKDLHWLPEVKGADNQIIIETLNGVSAFLKEHFACSPDFYYVGRKNGSQE